VDTEHCSTSQSLPIEVCTQLVAENNAFTNHRTDLAAPGITQRVDGLQRNVSLLSLPRSILEHIILFCPPRDFSALGATCSAIDELFVSDDLWRKLIQVRWRILVDVSLDGPRDYYIQRYLAEMEPVQPSEASVSISNKSTSNDLENLFKCVTVYHPKVTLLLYCSLTCVELRTATAVDAFCSGI